MHALRRPLDVQRHRCDLPLLRTPALSTKRRLTSAEAPPSKRGPHGGRLCRWCSLEVFPPRQTYCSEACIDAWRLRSDVAYLRSQVFLRDKGRCAHCQLDTLALRRRLFDLSEGERERVGVEMGFSAHHARQLQFWQADHTVPVCEGGGVAVGKAGGGLQDFRTLCTRCHLKKSTRERAARRVTPET